jgi:hypothetical protein
MENENKSTLPQCHHKKLYFCSIIISAMSHGNVFSHILTTTDDLTDNNVQPEKTLS